MEDRVKNDPDSSTSQAEGTSFEKRVRDARQQTEQDLGLMTRGIRLRFLLRRTRKAEGKNLI